MIFMDYNPFSSYYLGICELKIHYPNERGFQVKHLKASSIV
jgi:hypothetical protein